MFEHLTVLFYVFLKFDNRPMYFKLRNRQLYFLVSYIPDFRKQINHFVKYGCSFSSWKTFEWVGCLEVNIYKILYELLV